MVSVDWPQALARFIIPVLIIVVIAYIFRLFGFGWRIFKPARRNLQDEGDDGSFERQIRSIREGDFSAYVERMRQEIMRKAGEDPEFIRLRREYLQLVGQGSNRRDEKISREIDRVVVGMIDIYTRVTGREGMSITSGWRW